MAFNFPSLDAFSLQLTIHIAPENVEEFFKHFNAVFEKVFAEKDLVFFEVYQDPNKPGTLSWVENWDCSTEDFLKNQMTKEYYKPYMEATEKMFIKEREVKVLKRVKEFSGAKKGNFKGVAFGDFKG